MIDKLLIVVGILVVFCASAGADDHGNETYRWEDAEGNVFYSDLPPPASARNVKRSAAQGEAPAPDLPYELQAAVSKYPVTIYVTEGGVFDSADPPAQNDGVGDGTMAIEFVDCTEGLVTYEMTSPSVSGEIPIERITDDNVVLCELLADQ